MAWTSVGSEFSNPTTATSFTYAPSASGNVGFYIITGQSTTVFASGISSSNANWTLLAHFKGTAVGDFVSVFQADATSASSATATITWSGTTPTLANIRAGGFSFHTSIGYSGLATAVQIDVNGTAWPASGVAGLYFGWAFNSNTQAATTTSGFTSGLDGNGNPWAYNLAATAASAPVFPDTAPQLGYVIGLAEGSPVSSTGSAGLAAPGLAGTGSVVVNVTATGSLAVSSPAFTGVVNIVPANTGTLAAAALAMHATGTVVPPPVASTGSAQLAARTFTGAVTVANPVSSSGSLALGSRGMAGTAFNAPPVTASGTFRMADRAFTGSVAPAAFDGAPAGPPLPLNPLKPRVELWLRSSATWLDVSSRVFYDTVTLTHGGPDESTQTTAAQFSGTLDNSDGYLSTLNPSSPYHGQLGLNTPLRVSIPDGSNSMLCEGAGNDYASTPSAAALNPATDFEVWIDADLDNWYTPQVLAAKWAGSSNQRSWVLQTTGTGNIQFITSITGASGADHVFGVGATPIPIKHGRLSIRIVYTASNGGVAMYYGNYCAGWTSFYSAAFGSSMPLFASTAPIQVGYCTDYPDFPASNYTGLQGKVYAFALISGNGGSPSSNGLAVADFTQVAVGAATFTDSHSNTWTLNGTAAVTDRNYRFYGEASAWPQSWSVGDPNARVRITASGLLRRLGSTNTSLQSPMRRAYTRSIASIAGAPPIAYWPMEDGSNATSLASAIPGIPPLQISAPATPGNDSSLLASAPFVSLSGGSVTANTIPGYTVGASLGDTAGTIIRFALDIATSETVGSQFCSVWFSGGPISRVDFYYNGPGSVGAVLYDFTGTQISNTFASILNSPQTGRFSIEYTRGATTNSCNLKAAFIPSTGVTGTVATFYTSATQAPGVVTRIMFGSNPAVPSNNTGVGHLSIQTVNSSIWDLGGALTAYANEAAGRRFQRLCQEEGIPFRSIGNLDDTIPMGPQSIETLSQLLQECVDADQGIWYEPRQVLGWGFRTRASLQNQPVAVTFDYSKDQLSGSLEPTIDDQVIKNDVTITGSNGGSFARATLDDGSATSIGVIGRYDVEATVNVPDSGLSNAANWQLWALSCGDPRYTEIESDLANLGLDTAVYYGILGLEVGDRIQIINGPVWLPPGPVDQLIKGRTETISDKVLSFAWNTVPNTPYLTMVFDDATYGILEGSYSVLSL